MRREGQHVGDHPAVGEHLGRLAERVDEGVVEPALVDDLADVGEVRRALDRRAAARIELERLVLLDATSRSRGSPSRRSTCPSGRPAGDSSERIVCRSSSTSSSIGSSSCSSVSRSAQPDHLAGQPDVVLDHLRRAGPWRVTLSRRAAGGSPGGWKCTSLGASIWMWPGFVRHSAGGDAVRLGERAGERLVRAVARLDGDVEERRRRGDHPVRRPLEQDPPAERLRRLAGRPT